MTEMEKLEQYKRLKGSAARFLHKAAACLGMDVDENENLVRNGNIDKYELDIRIQGVYGCSGTYGNSSVHDCTFTDDEVLAVRKAVEEMTREIVIRTKAIMRAKEANALREARQGAEEILAQLKKED